VWHITALCVTNHQTSLEDYATSEISLSEGDNVMPEHIDLDTEVAQCITKVLREFGIAPETLYTEIK